MMVRENAGMCKNMQLGTCYDVSVNSTLSCRLTFAPVIFNIRDLVWESY